MNLHEDERAFKEMLMVASHPVEEGGIGVKLEFLEKDYWVTRSLKMLAKSRFVDQAVFKGGTSLSKACGVGYRFFGRLLAEDQARFAEPAGWQGKRIEDSPLIKSFNEVWRMLRPVYEHELASLAFRPVPEAFAVEESFVKIANLLTPPFN